MPEIQKKPCYKCPYRNRVIGSRHISCQFDFTGQKKDEPHGTEHGIRNGWWLFPVNYDPIWMEHPYCNVPDTETERDPAKVRKPNPLAEIVALLR